MEAKFEPKIRTIVVLIIGAFIMLVANYGCALDWINKLENGGDWFGNIFYHPLSGIITIIFFTMSAFFLLERISPGKMAKMSNYIDEKNQIKKVLILVTISSLILLLVDAAMLLSMYPAYFGVLVGSHIVLGVLLGLCLTIFIIKSLISKILDNPTKWQNYILIIVIITIIIFLIWLFIAAAMGNLST
jgi:hypothetical protein